MASIEWSEDRQVCYFDGGAWGVRPDLRSVYLGSAEEIAKKHPTRTILPKGRRSRIDKVGLAKAIKRLANHVRRIRS